MRTVSVRLADLEKAVIPIGFVGENQHTQVRIDCLKLYEEYPNAAASLTVKPPKGDPYPAVVTRDDNIVVWEIFDSDLVYDGNGEIQLAFTSDNVVARTFVGRIRILKSIIPTGEVPEPIDDFLTRAGAALTAIPETIDAALEDAKESGEFDGADGVGVASVEKTGTSGLVDTYTITLTNGNTYTFTVTNGKDGDDGYTPQKNVDYFDGQDGYSPVANVTKVGKVATIYIKDKNSETTQTVSDGEDGEDGDDGVGITSIAKTGTSGLVDTYTITLTNGQTATFTVTNGADGDPTVLIDDTKGTGTTDRTWSADKLDSIKNALHSLDESIAPVESSATATAAHAVGELFMFGETLMVALSAIAIGDTITTEGGTPNAAATTLSAKLIKDVQVNGTSILSQGVANIPYADANGTTYGLVRIQSSNGIILSSGNNGLSINPADSTNAKAGTNTSKPIVSSKQHEVVFYGLAKAAGDTTQSASANAVGVYTENALSKISDMLNAPVTVSGSTPSITAKSGVQYRCGEVSTLTITVPASGCIDVVFESGSTATVLTVTSAKSGVSAIKWANGFDPTALDANTTYEINILDGEFGVVGKWT